MTAIRLYGNDHSPWVQAVMMGLHQKNLECTRTTAPPVDVFKEWGVMMPAASFDDGPWEIESKDILHHLGYSEVSDEDMHAIRRAWHGVLHRAQYWTRFWGEWSLASDPSPSALGRFAQNFLRAFTAFYFFLLIRWGVYALGYRDPENYGDQYMEWEERFSAMDGPFLAGDEPASVELLLFGIIQCHCSIVVPPVYALQSDPRLERTRAWIGSMQEHFADYPFLYSRAYFEPHSLPPKPATAVEQLAFWLGALTMVACFPITVPLVTWLAYRNRHLRG